MGIFLGWIYLMSKSIWMPMIAHGAMNLTAMLMLNEIVMAVDKLYQGLIFMSGWCVVAVLVMILLNKREPELWQSKKENETVNP
jgi:membrane protease YdiL (CAAX protease family)